jgi:hypothetical protein
MKKVAPPKKLSAAILMALKDLEAVERDPRYKVNMHMWHGPHMFKCNVCFGGAVLAKTIKVDISKDFNCSDFGDDWKKVFKALDNVREGFVMTALLEMGLVTDEESDNWEEFYTSFDANKLNYQDDPQAFKDAMFDVATMLKVNGY